MSDYPVQSVPLSPNEINFLHKWMGKLIDRGDLLEEVVEDGEEYLAQELYKTFGDLN